MNKFAKIEFLRGQSPETIEAVYRSATSDTGLV